MYTGQSQRGLGCLDCGGTCPSSSGLGIAPAIASAGIQVINYLSNLFGGNGSYDETHAQILKLVQVILNDPAGAVSGTYLPGDGRWLESAANAYLALNCWAGNQAYLADYRRVSGDPASNGCGCETHYGCRRDAQTALAQVDAALRVALPALSSAPVPSNPAVTDIPASTSGTISQTLPGGMSVNVPVPASSIFNATVFGVPVMVWGLLGAAVAFSGGHSHGRRH